MERGAFGASSKFIVFSVTYLARSLARLSFILSLRDNIDEGTLSGCRMLITEKSIPNMSPSIIKLQLTPSLYIVIMYCTISLQYPCFMSH